MNTHTFPIILYTIFLVSASLGDHGHLFPLDIPPDIRRHYDLVSGQAANTSRRVPRQRGARQIVPGVYSCGHQGKDEFTNWINPHYPSPDNVAGTCHFRLVTSDPGVCQVSRLRSH